MAQDFNVELKDTGVHALAVWPLGVKTELSYEHILNNERYGYTIFLLDKIVNGLIVFTNLLVTLIFIRNF